MTRWLEPIRVIRASFIYQAKSNYFNIAAMLMWVFSPLIFGSTVALLYRGSSRGDLSLYAILGSVIYGIWNSSLFLSGIAVGTERWYGTMELHLASPARLGTVMLGRGLANGCQGVLSGSVALALVIPITGRFLDFSHAGALTVSAVFALLSISALSVCVAPLFFLARGPIGLLAVLDTGVIFASGTLYPLGVLPAVIRPVAAVLPLRWATDALIRSAGGPYDLNHLLLDWGMMALLAAVYTVLSGRLFALLERHLRSTGRLGGD